MLQLLENSLGKATPGMSPTRLSNHIVLKKFPLCCSIRTMGYSKPIHFCCFGESNQN